MGVSREKLQAISDWLVEQGLMENAVKEIVAGLCPRLEEAGLPLLRCAIAVRVLHPMFDAETVTWTRGQDVVRDLVHIDVSQNNPDYLVSPVRTVVENPERPLRRRLTGPDAVLDFPILESFAKNGGTDYYARVNEFRTFGRPGSTQGMVSTWLSDAPGGFTDEHIAAIEHLAPRIAVAVKAAIVHQIAGDAMITYLGADAGRRVLAGEIHRGDATTIRAVLLLADLRGFTALADRIPHRELVQMLGLYFDALVPPVQDRGGQVLKFMGDGLLATFDLADAAPRLRCAAAIEVARQALGQVSTVNRERRAAAQEAMDMDIILHVGDVMYGNVGSESRLDFTVIGPAVNEASRIEALCSGLGTNLIITKAVADHLDAPDKARLRSLGAHELRGVPSARELFTLDLP